jgi:hypothetical protein
MRDTLRGPPHDRAGRGRSARRGAHHTRNALPRGIRRGNEPAWAHDILIKHEGRNLFIAECKFWNGAKGFGGTIDQLFRYAGWRDTKLAIVMFVRQQGIGKIIDRGRAVLGEHPQFVSWRTAVDKAELRAVMSYPKDADRGAELTVFFVDTPE